MSPGLLATNIFLSFGLGMLSHAIPRSIEKGIAITVTVIHAVACLHMMEVF